MSEPKPYEVSISDEVIADLRQRIDATRWPAPPVPAGWDFGFDLGYLRELLAFWAGEYDWRASERELNGLSNWEWEGLHFIWERAARTGDSTTGLPILLVHGWPGAPIEFLDMIPLLVDAGHDVVVASLPGYAFSQPPNPPLNVSGMADRLRALMGDALGYERYIAQGGDWGSIISARMAFDAPEALAGIHLNAPFALPRPGNLMDPPLSDTEVDFINGTLRRWPQRGYHLLAQSDAPDALSPGMSDSPAGLAAWLVQKYRNWSDCDGNVEARFSKTDLCDFLTIYWATESIGSSMRLYAAEAHDRWRLEAGEVISVPSAVADFPAEIIRTPREFAERTLSDLRQWTEMPRGGHFAAFEEPELLAADVLAFVAGLA